MKGSTNNLSQSSLPYEVDLFSTPQDYIYSYNVYCIILNTLDLLYILIDLLNIYTYIYVDILVKLFSYRSKTSKSKISSRSRKSITYSYSSSSSLKNKSCGSSSGSIPVPNRCSN